MTLTSSASSADHLQADALNDDKPAIRRASHEAQDDVNAVEATKKEEGVNSAADDDEPEPEYLAGVKLALVMAGVTIVMILAMLDVTILSTVRQLSYLKVNQSVP